MKPVAYLTANCMFKEHPDARADYWEHDLVFRPLQAACAANGIELSEVIWNDPALEPDAFEAFVIGTTWDYAEQPDAFLDQLERCAAHAPLFNPLSIVRWNLEKTYLRELAELGVPVVPTLWRERADAATIQAAFEELGSEELVVKPVVGASAWRQARIKRGAPLPPTAELPPARTMLQPFLPAAAEEGEFSFLFFDGAFSHCAQKLPAAGDYRVQSMFGGHERVHTPSREELALARSVLDAVDERLLYARVDMLRNVTGELVLMELELVEPYLYPEQGPQLGEHFSTALGRLLS